MGLENLGLHTTQNRNEVNFGKEIATDILLGKEKNNTQTVQAESPKFASFLFDQGFQIFIPPRILANVPEPIGTPSDGILH